MQAIPSNTMFIGIERGATVVAVEEVGPNVVVLRGFSVPFSAPQGAVRTIDTEGVDVGAVNTVSSMVGSIGCPSTTTSVPSRAECAGECFIVRPPVARWCIVVDAKAEGIGHPEGFRFKLDSSGTFGTFFLIFLPVTASIIDGAGPGIGADAEWAGEGGPPPSFTRECKGLRVLPAPATLPTTTGAGPVSPRGLLLFSFVSGSPRSWDCLGNLGVGPGDCVLCGFRVGTGQEDFFVQGFLSGGFLIALRVPYFSSVVVWRRRLS